MNEPLDLIKQFRSYLHLKQLSVGLTPTELELLQKCTEVLAKQDSLVLGQD